LIFNKAGKETSVDMKSEILLIGPRGSGKSTVAELIHMRTFLPHCSMDLLRWKYYDEIGYDRRVAGMKLAQEGFWGMYNYWKPFEAYAVGRLLEDFRECVFDFGASHTVYEEHGLFEQVRRLIDPYPHVILLLPSPDQEESIRILHARNAYDTPEQKDVNEHLVRHHSNYDLAKYIAYTKDKTPEETCDEVLTWVRNNGWTYEP
jgi:energy-coupling factor transporter ATP-binding protein EcfA2